jgi:hypothetical protein
MKILLEDCNAKLEREDICKLTVENQNLYENDSDNDVRIVNFATSILVVRASCSHTETFINTPGPLLIGRLTTRLITY